LSPFNQHAAGDQGGRCAKGWFLEKHMKDIPALRQAIKLTPPMRKEQRRKALATSSRTSVEKT
jgi:hypothetical protein